LLDASISAFCFFVSELIVTAMLFIFADRFTKSSSYTFQALLS
jgi:hypothetical protein